MSPVHLPHTIYEQREPFYADILRFLDPGFLLHRVRINGIDICIRSPFPSDYLLAEHLSSREKEKEWLCKFLSLCTWSVDHHIITDPNLNRRIFLCYKSLRSSSLTSLFGVLRGLLSRMKNSVQELGIFSQETYSRILWAQYGGKYSSVIVQGKLSPYREMNAVQKMWTYYNSFKDKEERDTKEWIYVRTLLSPHVSKSGRNWAEQDKNRAQRMEEERRISIDEFYYKKIGVLDSKGFDREGVKGPVKSYETLADEFRRWVRGELDDHDHAVEKFKRELREKWEEGKKKREGYRQQALLAKKLELEEEPGLQKPFKMMGYTEGQLSEILKKKPHRGSTIIDRQGSSYIYEKWIENEPQPYKREKSLQDDVEQRSRLLAGESDG